MDIIMSDNLRVFENTIVMRFIDLPALIIKIPNNGTPTSMARDFDMMKISYASLRNSPYIVTSSDNEGIFSTVNEELSIVISEFYRMSVYEHNFRQEYRNTVLWI